MVSTITAIVFPTYRRGFRPINALLRKGVKFSFTPAMDKLVREILAKLTTAPVLVFPYWDAVADGTRPFHVYCDACIDGFGAALEQEKTDGSIKPIAYINRAALDRERRWTPLDLEAGSIVWALKRLRGYHVPNILKPQGSGKHRQSGNHNARVQRWLEFLTAFEYILEYRKGSANGNADFLSSSNPPLCRWPAGGCSHDFSLVLAPVFPSLSTRARLAIVPFLWLVCRRAFPTPPRHTGGMRQVLEPFLPPPATPAVRGSF